VKKISIFLFLCLLLSGCATYKFQRGSPPYDKGYVVSRDDYSILEYTVGKDNSVPEDLDLAKQRFQRRKVTVEEYYKQMGYIESRFKETFWNPPVMLVKFIGGIFRLPFIAISDYKYEHNPQYREKIKKQEEKQAATEEAHIQKLKEQLSAYIQKDLAKEPPPPPAPPKIELAKIEPEVPPQEKPISEVTPEISSQVKPKPAEPKFRTTSKPPIAVIIAQPTKGYSPLKVHFYGEKSHSPSGKIVSYYWEFGDGDTSTKENPINTYWSATYGSRNFTATLTIKDNKGNTASASKVIEVMTK
jgi:hypothetical protein